MDPSIFRAYDIRGIYGTELTDEGAYRIGKAIYRYLKPKKVAVGRDARLGGPGVQKAVAQALAEEGCEIVDLGMVSTDMGYFAAGKYDFDVVIQATASHNPSEWIGLKITKRGGLTVGGAGEIQEIQALVQDEVYTPNPLILSQFVKEHIMSDWVKHVLSFIDLSVLRPMYMVIDTGNGVAGPMVREIFQYLPVAYSPMYFEPDGHFPNHVPSPIEPENTAALRSKVISAGADMGLAFDGDADRVFLIDENGELVSGSEMTAMVADEILSQDPTKIILYNTICGWNVRDVLAKYGATSYQTKVGHGYIKKDMRKYDAYFAGEHSGHYFLKDNYCADSGIIAALIVLQLVSKRNQPLSEILEPYRKYRQIPETNFVVRDVETVLQAIAQKYVDGTIDWSDGLTVKYEDFWFNIRPSSNEPLLRLNLEAVDSDTLRARNQELTEAIQEVA